MEKRTTSRTFTYEIQATLNCWFFASSFIKTINSLKISQNPEPEVFLISKNLKTWNRRLLTKSKNCTTLMTISQNTHSSMKQLGILKLQGCHNLVSLAIIAYVWWQVWMRMRIWVNYSILFKVFRENLVEKWSTPHFFNKICVISIVYENLGMVHGFKRDYFLNLMKCFMRGEILKWMWWACFLSRK